MESRRRVRRSIVVWCALFLGVWALVATPSRAEEPMGLVDWLEARGEAADFAARAARYKALFPGSAYDGTAEENLRLLAALRRGERPSPAVTDVGPTPDATFDIVQLGWRVVLDRSAQVLALRMPRDVSSGWMGDESEGRILEPILQPLLPRMTGLIPAAVLAQKAKIFDDGLYAAVEGAVHGGHGAFPGTGRLLKDLAGVLTLAAAPEPMAASSVIHAGLRLGRGWNPNLPLPGAEALAPLLQAFYLEENRSKPLGFYTWSRDLGWIFRQDRMLQTRLARDASLETLLGHLRSNTAARATYAQWMELVERLTNPFAYADLRDAYRTLPPPTTSLHVLPPSRSHETELAKRLWGNRPVPEGAVLMDRLVEEVRAGRISLEPTPGSGWYDHQTWALEPLLRPEATPEAEKLRYDATYTDYLEQLFRALLALTRETHTKQLETPACGMAMRDPRVIVRPDLTVEPLPTFYARRADAYRFVRGILEDAFGTGSLRTLHRRTPDVARSIDLDAELLFMERLFRGAAERSFREIGSDHAQGGAEATLNLATFDAWRAVLPEDPDLRRDARMMVPVFYDLERRKTKVWVFLGWSERPLSIRYEKPPRVISREDLWPGTQGTPEIEFQGQGARVAYPVMAEVYVSELMNREEFRAHCDRHKTRSAILLHLK